MTKITENSEAALHSLRGKVFSQIESRILNGLYKSGESLNESKLSIELGVSRTPIREAIRQLELEGLVSYIPNKGAIVNGVDHQDVRDIYEMRSIIEGLASKKAAYKISKEELKELKEVIEFEEFYTKKRDAEQLLKLDNKFHEIIFKASGSRVLTKTLMSLHHYVENARISSLRKNDRAENSYAEHMEIYNAIEAGDGERAEKMTAEHIQKAYLNLITELQDN